MPLSITFKDKSKIVKRKLQIAKERSLRAGGPIGVDTMQSLVPIDTWSLHDSIRITLELESSQIVWKAGGSNQSASQLNDPVVYAQVVEFGRSDLPAHPAQPYFVPGPVEAVNKIRSSAIQQLKSTLKWEDQHMKEIKEAIFTKITSILATAGKSKVKIYPLNQVAPKAKRPYIEYNFTMVGATGKNERLALLDILLHAKNTETKQEEAEEIADLFTIEGLADGLENETVITVANKIALEFRMINRSTPETAREKIKSISLTYDVMIIDKRSVIDPLVTP